MIKNQYRFFVSTGSFNGQKVLINDQDLVHQLSKVLRLKTGDQIILLDNSGFEYLVNLEKIADRIEGWVMEKIKNTKEPDKKIILCQSLLKNDRFEQVLKFCTNLGISGFMPFISEKSISQEINPNKLERYQKIIQESAEQAGRGFLPKLEKLASFDELLKLLKENKTLKLIGWEQEKEKKLLDFSQEIDQAEKIYLVIGPEGGLTEKEIKLTVEAGCFSYSLGPLVLRSEIAGLVSAAFIFQH